MWFDLVSWTLDFLSGIGAWTDWLFTPFKYDSVFSILLERYWGITLSFRPIDLISASLLTTLVIFLLIKLISIFS